MADQPLPPGGFVTRNTPISPEGPLTASQIQQATEQSNAHEAQLQTPAAQEARAQSSDAFADLSSVEAAGLMTNEFDSVLAQATVDPAEPVRDADRVLKFRADNVALVDPAGPETRGLVASTDPLRTTDGSLPDLDLESRGDEIEPQAALAEVTIPDELADGAEFDSVDVGVDFAGAAGADPNSMLISTEGSPDKEIAFYPEVQKDTDVAIAPVAQGMETFTQLRSEESPEQLRLQLDLPDGARIVSSGPVGDAKVVDGGNHPLMSVTAPVATDAQGTPVAVTMEVEGSDLVLKVPHREADLAYPILVDPLMEYWSWFNPYDTAAAQDFIGWYRDGYGYSNYGGYQWCNGWSNYDCYGYAGGGLIMYAPPGYWFPAGSTGQWLYTPPGTSSYIYDAYVYYFRYWLYQYASPSSPYAFFGLYSACCAGYVYSFMYGAEGSAAATGNISTRTFIMGLWANYTATTNGYWRYLRIPQLGFTMTDPEAPWLGSLSGQFPAGCAVPSGGQAAASCPWIAAQSPLAFSPVASDPGFGVKYIRFTGHSRDNPGQYYTKQWNAPNASGQPGTVCSGLSPDTCPPSTDSLPAAQRPSISFDPSKVPEGADPATNTVAVQAEDALQQTSIPQNYLLKVDGQYPTVTSMSGELYDTRTEALAEDADNDLTVTAHDGDASSPATAQSGIKKVEILIDGHSMPATPDPAEQSCPAALGSCPMTRRFVLSANAVGPGTHQIQVKVTDQVGHVSSTLPWTKRFAQDQDVVDALCQTAPPEVTASSNVLTAEQAVDSLNQESPAVLAPSQGTTDTGGEVVDPGLEPATEDPAIPDSPDVLPIVGTENEGDVSTDAEDGFDPGGTECLRPGITTPDATDAPVAVNGDSAVYANSAPATDTVVRPSALGTEIITNVRGEAAPDSYSWRVALNDGEVLQKLPNGSVAVVDTATPAPANPPSPGPAPDAQTLDDVPDAQFQLIYENYYVTAAQVLSPYEVELVIPPPQTCDPFAAPSEPCYAGELELEHVDPEDFNAITFYPPPAWRQHHRPKKRRDVVHVVRRRSFLEHYFCHKYAVVPPKRGEHHQILGDPLPGIYYQGGMKCNRSGGNPTDMELHISLERQENIPWAPDQPNGVPGSRVGFFDHGNPPNPWSMGNTIPCEDAGNVAKIPFRTRIEAFAEWHNNPEQHHAFDHPTYWRGLRCSNSGGLF